MLKPSNLFEYQRKAILHQLSHDKSMLWLGCGLGKCWGYGTELLLFNGGVKQVQDVVVGDKLAHPVCGYQTVTGTNVGHAPMYRVSSTSVRENKFKSFTCNADHILSLEQAGRNIEDGVVEMTVAEYMVLSNRDKRLRYKLYRSSVTYDSREVKIDPYVLGAWLGDGHHNSTTVTLNDSDAEYILPAFVEESKKYGTKLRRIEYDTHCTGYAFTHGTHHHGKPNWLFHLRDYEICHYKNIPDDYLYNDRNVRYEMLAGLLDTDGYLGPDGTCFEIAQKHKPFAERICQLVSGLGLNSNMREKIVNGVSYWRIQINGDTDSIPTRVPRKTARKREQHKRSNVFGFKVEEIGNDFYYGFTLDGDGLCLLKDCIVTHNTPTTLTTIEHRMRAGQVTKTLVFGPLRVIHAVWEREARKWEHTKHLRFSVIHGNEKKRLRQLFASADIYLCNYENMGWLSNVLDHYYLSQGKPLPFQMVVYDEITRVKNSNSQRVSGGNITRQKLFVRQPHEMSEQQMKGAGLKGKALREEKELVTARNIQRYQEMRQQFPRNKDDMINKSGELVVVPEIKERIIGWREMSQHFKYTTGLTGTPSSNGYIDLHGQYLVIDNGERLGQYVSHFRDSYFAQGYDGWTYEITEVGKKWIEHKIADITIKMDSEDYLTLPPLKINDIMVDLPPKVMQQYNEVEKDMFTKLDNGTEIELFNRASVSNKTLQFANGSPYNEPLKPEWTALHDEKLQALDSIVEEAQGKTILLGYSFKSDAERIMKRYKHLKPVNLTGEKPENFLKILDKGNKGHIKLMIAHPKSVGHGVDGLNDFCHIIVWFGLPWGLEDYEQLIGRIASGQRFKQPVTMHRILCNDTIDLAVADALRRKDSDQVGLKKAIQRYRDGILNDSIDFM